MKALFAELFGTFCLVFVGCGAVVLNDLSGGAVTHLGVSATFGLVVALMIYLLGSTSGAHINPAVTVGFWISGRFPAGKVMPYLFMQFLGALLAALLLYLLAPAHETLASSLPAGPAWQSFLLETCLTLVLMLSILLVTAPGSKRQYPVALIIGGVVGLEAFIGGPVSGASMNPARSLGPAVISGHLEHLWLYFLAHVIGAVAAFGCCRLLRSADCCCSKYSLKNPIKA